MSRGLGTASQMAVTRIVTRSERRVKRQRRTRWVFVIEAGLPRAWNSRVFARNYHSCHNTSPESASQYVLTQLARADLKERRVSATGRGSPTREKESANIELITLRFAHTFLKRVSSWYTVPRRCGFLNMYVFSVCTFVLWNFYVDRW